jgi:hypothetical protein
MTDVSICNLALTYLSTSRIASLDEGSENARKLLAIYDLTRDGLLSDHNWNFARTESTLATVDAECLTGDWLHIYQLPNDCLRVMRLVDDKYFAIFSDRLYSNTETATIEYIKQVTNPQLFSPMFVKCFAARLAADLSYGITQNATLAQAMESKANQLLKEAKWNDAQEGVNTFPLTGSMIEARQ